MLLKWLATLDSSRTFIREKATYSDSTGITCILSTTSNISLLYPRVFVKRIKPVILLGVKFVQWLESPQLELGYQ